MWRGREKEASRYLPHHFLLWPRFSYSCSCIFFTKYDTPKTNKQTNKQSPTGDFSRLPTKVWERTKIFLARKKWLWSRDPQLSRQKQKHHGETKNLTAKTKYLTAKPKTSRQNQILHSKNKIALVLPWVFLLLPWGIWFLLWSICFCREVFGFAVRVLVLPWGFRFCGEVFCFYREVFGFAVTVVLATVVNALITISICELEDNFLIFLSLVGDYSS